MHVSSDRLPDHAALARGVAAALAEVSPVRAVRVIGSTARGAPSDHSDVDLLVVTPDRRSAGDLMRLIDPELRDPRLSLIVRTEESWLRTVDTGSLFALHVRLEGQTLHDPDHWLAMSLVRAAGIPPDVPGELARQRRRLRVYDELDRLHGRHLFALSDLFSIGKAAAIAHCVAHGEPIFVKERALARAGALRSDLAWAARSVATLAPFYERVRGREVGVPFEPDGDVARVERARRAAMALCRA